MGYRSLGSDISSARHIAKLNEYDSPVFIGNTHWYDPVELYQIDAKVMVRESRIYLIECPLDVHEYAKALLLRELEWSLSTEIDCDKIMIISGEQGTFSHFVNKFMRTQGVGKYPDGAITLNFQQSWISRPVILEVGFRNQKLRDLLIEGANWVNNFTDTDVCVLLECNETEGKIDVDSFGLYVFKRISPFWSLTTFKPTTYCRDDWSCSLTLEEIRALSASELEELFQVKVVGHFPRISRESLVSWQQIVVEFPTEGLNNQACPIKLFKENTVKVDFTKTFLDLFALIDFMVANESYPLNIHKFA